MEVKDDIHVSNLSTGEYGGVIHLGKKPREEDDNIIGSVLSSQVTFWDLSCYG